MSRGTADDKDDIFIENLNTAMLLLLGVLAVATSVILFGYQALAAAYSQELSLSLFPTSIFAVLLFALGLGSVHLFQKRRKQRRKKTAALF